LILVLIISLSNQWIWRIAQLNFNLFLFLLVISLVLYKSLESRKYYLALIILVGLSLFFQWRFTNFESLNLLSNDEQRVQTLRLKFYNPEDHYTRVIFYRLNLKNFLEGNFTIVTTRILKNFFETIDPNVYFFAGHPRERVGIPEFEKFPYIFALPFMIGFFNLIGSKKILFFINFLFCILLLSIIGHKSSIGAFILFPFFVVAITCGIKLIFKGVHA